MSSANNKTTVLAYIAELHRAVHAVGLFLDERLGGRVSQPEALALLHLSAKAESSVNELHHAFLHRRSTLTGVLDRLEEKGMIERRPSTSDRRSVQVALTARGRRLADEIARAFDVFARRLEPSMRIGSPDVKRLRNIAETAASLANSDS